MEGKDNASGSSNEFIHDNVIDCVWNGECTDIGGSRPDVEGRPAYCGSSTYPDVYCCDDPGDCIDLNFQCNDGGCCEDFEDGGGNCCLHDYDCCDYDQNNPEKGSICKESDPDNNVYGYCDLSAKCDCTQYTTYDCNPWLGGCEIDCNTFCCQVEEGTTGFTCGEKLAGVTLSPSMPAEKVISSV